MDRDLLSGALRPLLPELTRFARWLVRPSESAVEVADELTHDVVVRALQHAGSIEDPTRLKAWLFRIARNTYCDGLRSRAVRDHFVVLDGGLAEDGMPSLPLAAPMPILDLIDVERALQSLPEGVRSVILLADLWQFSYEELAEILDIPLNTVRSRVARARARLAAQLCEAEIAPASGGRSA
jgi:RNA polymerase sigma-70 factor (ECF subfamily)